MRSLRTAATVSAALLACVHGPSPKERRSAEIHHDLGVEALRAGRAPEAIKEFDEALESDPRFPEAHLGRGLVLELGFGKLEEAEKEYRSAIELLPGYSEAHNDLGQLLAKTGRWDDALKEFDAALENMLYKEPWVARCNKGQALYRMGSRAEGLAEMRACLQAAPAYCDGRRELGRTLLGDGKVKDAVTELDAYARTCERRPDSHLQLGLARMKAGDIAGARAAFERCKELGDGTSAGEECRRSLALLVE
ncbi:tetratricopeptide repeat protein [Anaeromyxobacter oryzae]|uniref:Lipoprotein n=1 Tax=Anaeromyxobacter oryzae TaxID=2918170 RepID=A0ABN6N2H5_9BACT|nr:tetratricopeptide repeat protein [Anaeromyxobacter oryzae]BDG06213.1 lipoprotein [Anaeromyxobacter oryzae]